MTIQFSKLPCGIQIATDAMPTVETVSMGIWVGAGSRHETDKNNGVAHFLEHMAFKGTEKRSALKIAEEIEAVGGYLNAYTSKEVTAYYARVLKNDTKLALDILADILQNSIFDPAELEREREVILQEIGQCHDTPDDVIHDHFQEVSYPNQPLGRPILGPSTLIKRMSRDVLIDFMTRHYDPKNIVLVASGNVNHDQIVEWAETLLSLKPIEDKPIFTPATFVGGDFREQKDLEQLHFLMGLVGPSATEDRYYDGLLFSTIFGGGMASRLFQEVREKRGLAYSIYSFLTGYSDSGILGVYAGTSEKDAATLVNVIIDELHKMTKTIKEEEVLRAKAQMKASLLMGLESSSSRARRIAHTLLSYGHYVSLEEVIQKIDQLTVDHAYDFARSILSKPLSLASIGPIKNVPTFEEVKKRIGS
jgi:predicted Zn-dependent peptidase